MEHNDYPIGRIIDYNGVKLLVKANKQPTCVNCYFSAHQCRKERRKEISCINHGFACTPHLRKDKKHVVYVKVLISD